MTPKEKAIELYYRFTMYAPLHSNNKQCALIAVDEVLNMLEDNSYIKYWLMVKHEIGKL